MITMIIIYVFLLVLIEAGKLENAILNNITYNNQYEGYGENHNYDYTIDNETLSQQTTTKSGWFYNLYGGNDVTTTKITVSKNKINEIITSTLPYSANLMDQNASTVERYLNNNSGNQDSNVFDNDLFFNKTCSFTPNSNPNTEEMARRAFQRQFSLIKSNFENLTKYDKNSKSKLVSKYLNAFLYYARSNDCEVTWDYLLQLKRIIDLLFKTGDVLLLDKEVVRISYQRQLSNFAIGLQQILELHDEIGYERVGVYGMWDIGLKRKIKKRIIELKLQIANSFEQDVRDAKDNFIIWKYEHKLSRIMNKTILSVNFFTDNEDLIAAIKELRKYLDTFD